MTITRKQIGVIFKNWKQGTIATTEKGIKYFYTFADYSSDWDAEMDEVKGIIDCLFAGDYEEAQRSIDYLAGIHQF